MTQHIDDHARRLLDLQVKEAALEAAFDAAVGYYHSGNWQKDGIAVETFEPLFAELRILSDERREERLAQAAVFETAVAQVSDDASQRSVTRSNAVRRAREERLRQSPARDPNPFHAWLASHGVELTPFTEVVPPMPEDERSVVDPGRGVSHRPGAPSSAAKGKLHANLNPAKTPGDKRPAFQGTITLPGDAVTRALVLWTNRDKKGDVFLTGKAGLSAVEHIDQLAGPSAANVGGDGAPLTNGSQFAIDPYQVVLFTAREKKRNGPEYHGLYHPGPDAPLMHLAVWAKTDQDGKPRLSGIIEPHRAALERERDDKRGRRRERER